MHGHPTDGEVQAVLDGELPLASWLRLRWHLQRCARCRRRLAGARARNAAVGELLKAGSPAVDVEEGWARFHTRTGRARPERRQPFWRQLALLLLLLAGGTLATPLWRRPSKSPSGDQVVAIVREARAHPASTILRDECCGDHDGGNRPDDGLLTLSSRGERVSAVIIYEDVDHSGTFTPVDVVRYVSMTTPR